MADAKKAEKTVENLISLIRMFHAMKYKEMEKDASPLPADPQYWILGMLMHCKPLPISEIGRRLHRSKPNMTAIIGRLISEKKVERIPDGKDRRVTNISLTEKGKKFMSERQKIVKVRLKEKLSTLSEGDLDELFKSSGKMSSIISKLE